jgi:hypothetical protein
MALAGLCGAAPLHAGSCSAVEKAVEAGMRQARIFAASYEQRADGKPGKNVMMAITIDNTHYLFEGGRSFKPAPLESDDMRKMGSGLIGFSPGTACVALGPDKIAGNAVTKFSYETDLGNGPAKVTLWIDQKSGLPVRGTTDEPDVDVDINFSKDGDLKTVKTPTGKRVRHVNVFLFGDSVKAPIDRTLDPAMQAAAEALK